MWWLIFGLLIVIGVWLYFKPAWAPQPTQVQGELAKSVRLVGDRAGTMYAGLGGWLKLRRDKSQLVTQFQTWAATDTLNQAAANAELAGTAAELKTWLATLSDKELKMFCDKVAHFTAALGFDLAWLWDDQLRGQAELKRALEEAVALYCITVWRAQRVQDEVRAFVAWDRWQAHPNKHRALGQKMYTALVQNGMIMMDVEMYTASDKARWAQMNRSIKEVARANPEAVSAIVRGMVFAHPQPPAAPSDTSAQA